MPCSCQPQQQPIKVKLVSQHSSSRQQQLRSSSSILGALVEGFF
jgi:hypothetical protein